MGILDFFGGGSEQDKAKRLKAKVTQKYGDPVTRQKALAQLGQMKDPEAVRTLLSRFTITVEPQTVDADEKDHTYELIRGFRQDAVAPLREFLRRSDAASSWAVRLLASLLPEPEMVGVLVEELVALGPEYTRDPEKKTVLIHWLTGKDDPRIAPALLPFLEDPADDVKIAAIKGLAAAKHEPAREPLMKLIVSDEVAKRVQTAAISAAHEAELGVQGFREKVEARLADPYFVDKAGLIKKRG